MTEERSQPSLLSSLRAKVSAPADDQAVPRSLRVATAYAWRLLIVAAAAAVLIWLIIKLKLLVVPFLVALLLAALLQPVMRFLVKRRVPRWAAVAISLVGTLAVVTGLLWLAIWQVSQQVSDVQERTMASVDALRHYLTTGPLQLSDAEIDDYIDKGLEALQGQASFLISGAVAVGSTVGHLATGLLLVFFILLCVLFDGEAIWGWTLKIFPKQARDAIDGSARKGWQTVVNYARTQLLVAVIDAIGIGLAAFFLGVPLAVPIGILVFLGSFIPIVGAVVTGALAVLFALVYNGWVIAIIMLIAVLLVQQIEGHILQPLLMGAAVKVHPLAVVLAVAGGAMIAGIPGSLFAVPIVAFINVVAVSLSDGSWRSASSRTQALIWQTVPKERPSR